MSVESNEIRITVKPKFSVEQQQQQAEQLGIGTLTPSPTGGPLILDIAGEGYTPQAGQEITPELVQALQSAAVGTQTLQQGTAYIVQAPDGHFIPGGEPITNADGDIVEYYPAWFRSLWSAPPERDFPASRGYHIYQVSYDPELFKLQNIAPEQFYPTIQIVKQVY